MKEEVELVDGKFVVKSKQEKEVKHEEIKVIPKQYSEEVITLKERVVNGNQILFDAWLKIKEIPHDTEEWSKEMDRWHEAGKRLGLLCSELNHKGFDVCLYLDENGKKTKNCLSNPDGFWCLVCPSFYPYWEKELMDLPSAGGK